MKKTLYISLTLILTIFSTTKLIAQELTVMCYNTKSFEGMDDIPEHMFVLENFAEEIKRFNPDVICMQELETHTSRQGSREMLTELGRLLGMYPYFGYSYDKEKSNHGYYGNGILSKYPIINSHSEQLPYNTWWSYDQRSFQYVDILVPIKEGSKECKMVRIINTHFDHKGGETDEHAEIIVKKALKPGLPALFMGDFNTGLYSSAMESLLKVCDVMCDGLDDRSLPTYDHMSKIDWILSYPKGAFESVFYTVDYKNERSDHHPLVSTVIIK